MESRNTQTANRQTTLNHLAEFESDDELVLKRLNALIAINAKNECDKALFSTDREKFESELMENPLTMEKTLAYFGLMLGTFPPLAFFTKFIIDGASFRNGEQWIIGVFLIVTLISAVVGYFSGKFIGKTVTELEKLSWTKMLSIAPFVGLVWGIIAGGAGGVIIFFVGAIFGAMLGGLVGAAALPVFVGLHRLMKKGDLIEQKHFFPIAFGITFTICSFILGL